MKLKLIFVLFISSFLYSQQIEKFEEKIFIETNGNAKVNWEIEFVSIPDSNFLLPWNFNGSDLIQSEIQNIKLQLVNKNENKFLIVKNLNTKKVEINFSINSFYKIDENSAEDFGNYVFKYRFVNTTLEKINNFSSTIILPKEFIVSSIDETIPKQSEDNPVFPFQVTKENSNHAVKLIASKLKLGDQTFIKMQIKKEKKSLMVLILFSLIGIAYLYFFKDLIKPNQKN